MEDKENGRKEGRKKKRLTCLFGITLMAHKIELFYYFDIIILNDPIKTSNITHCMP